MKRFWDIFGIENLINPNGQDAEGVSTQPGVRARRVPPVWRMHESHPGGVPEQQGKPCVGALFQSATTLWHPSGGIRYAQTTRLPSGDAFSVIERVKFLKLPSGDAFSVITKVDKTGTNIVKY